MHRILDRDEAVTRQECASFTMRSPIDRCDPIAPELRQAIDVQLACSESNRLRSDGSERAGRGSRSGSVSPHPRRCNRSSLSVGGHERRPFRAILLRMPNLRRSHCGTCRNQSSGRLGHAVCTGGRGSDHIVQKPSWRYGSLRAREHPHFHFDRMSMRSTPCCETAAVNTPHPSRRRVAGCRPWRTKTRPSPVRPQLLAPIAEYALLAHRKSLPLSR
ncbi:hypothetical protein SAMN05216338_104044 [Bradyrhizobium sp. Rc2d]|nr:hypothetical protein SAMN05216338_104044 [Bradyrhizobium sp. Rc2d]